MARYKKKIYIIGCIMWDIIGKPLEQIVEGKDCSGLINEQPGGVAFNIALGLSKVLDESSFEINLVSAIGENDKTRMIRTILKENKINTKYLIIKGTQSDKYLSIETTYGEIFGSINSSNTFISNQNDIINNFSRICSAHKKNNSSAIFIFDGNCKKSFFDFVKKEASEDIFTKYFIPANFSKLTQFKNNASYFRGFNLVVNLKEANILIQSKTFKNSMDASKAIFEKIKTETNFAIITDGPNTACGISKKGVVTVWPKAIKGSKSRLGAGDAFFAYFLSHKELNPAASFKKSLNAANKATQNYLKAND